MTTVEKLKVHETKLRSLLKAISFRIIEISVDTFILSFFVTPQVALGLAISLELICFLLHFGFERIWNRIDFGRKIVQFYRCPFWDTCDENEEDDCPTCKPKHKPCEHKTPHKHSSSCDGGGILPTCKVVE